MLEVGGLHANNHNTFETGAMTVTLSKAWAFLVIVGWVDHSPPGIVGCVDNSPPGLAMGLTSPLVVTFIAAYFVIQTLPPHHLHMLTCHGIVYRARTLCNPGLQRCNVCWASTAQSGRSWPDPDSEEALEKG
jgi:hypothetical protein